MDKTKTFKETSEIINQESNTKKVWESKTVWVGIVLTAFSFVDPLLVLFQNIFNNYTFSEEGSVWIKLIISFLSILSIVLRIFEKNHKNLEI